MNATRFSPALLLAAFLLPACSQWHLGERLRDNQTTYTGVDANHPVDGTEYHGRLNGKAVTYAILPEYTYNRRRPLLYTDFPKPGSPYSVNLRPTGRTVIFRSGVEPYTTVPALPRGLTAKRKPQKEANILPLPLSEHTEEPGWARQALTATCDYALDPLLTLITIPLEGCLYAVLIPVALTSAALEDAAFTQQQQSPSPAEPTTNQ